MEGPFLDQDAPLKDPSLTFQPLSQHVHQPQQLTFKRHVIFDYVTL